MNGASAGKGVRRRKAQRRCASRPSRQAQDIWTRHARMTKMTVVVFISSNLSSHGVFGRFRAGVRQVLRHRVDYAFERTQGSAAAVTARFEGGKLFDSGYES